MLEVRNIKKRFNNELVLKDISFNVNKSDVVCILGSSGSGKSTLLRMINRLEKQDSGEIIYNKKNINEENINILRTKIGMVFQSFNLFNNMSVIKNCIIGPIKVLKKSKEEATKKALEILDMVGMLEYKDKNVNLLSGGQKQRAAIARTLCMDPELILFDEPTSALDPEMVGEVLNVIKKIKKSGITMIIVTHELQFAKEVSSRILFMSEGVILEDSNTFDFFNDPKTERARDFLKRFNSL